MNNFFVGIDFSKQTFDATILKSNELSGKGVHSQFKNSATGFKSFTRWMAKETGTKMRQEFLICGENTGIYSRLISDSLVREGYSMWLENALQIKRSLGLSREKSDLQDSRNIAEYAGRHADRFNPYKLLSADLEALKVLFTERRQLVQEISNLSRRKNELEDFYKKNSYLRPVLEWKEELISIIKEKITKTEELMKKIIRDSASLSRTYDILTSMKGVGFVNATALIVYTSNFEKFDYDARKMCCYWGLAPFDHTSGTSINGKPHGSFYADKYLKSLISEAALSACRFCPAIKAYAERLKRKGKHPSIILNNCKNKLIHTLVKMVKDGRKYGDVAKSENEKFIEKSDYLVGC